MRSYKLMLSAGLAAISFLLTLAYLSRERLTNAQHIWEPRRRPLLFFPDNNSNTNEKYITFYPHSGLHNQRLGLLNAMVLAKALDRTLILPQINLGKGVYWWESPLLAQKLSDCPELPLSERKGLCADYRKYIPVPVSSVFDLSVLNRLGIRYIERDSMHTSYLSERLGIHDDEIYHVSDHKRFSYRIYDNVNSTDPLNQFKYRINLQELEARPEQLIEFGSLFGTPRLVLDVRNDLYWLREHLSGELGFGNPTVIHQTLNVVGRLGGPGNFVSVHLRTGDGVFKVTMARTMDKVRQTLERYSTQHRLHHEQEYAIMARLQALAHEGQTANLLNECTAIQHQRDMLHPRLRLIFMATDTAQPRHTLPELFEEFVCMFTLPDFPDVIQDTVAGASTPAREQNDHYGPLLLPLIDAEVASHGSFFVGTRKSTFSKYIQYRNRRFLSYYPAVAEP
ncbi:hypothetical protein BDB00DRAFT_799615 [Zychaea mexicana]|uniref:uncharacterized protein n=1 Tax=Zychaea mexicana TaxID=64656 RepID=UPI0022FED13D|nr:uncharacterized protein BDB00DRAFT_799615 [Zychaea mexicana]KAI9498814.1 hypothetical protein BDB00DRAFT_799615 [Zychaea mexicana]